MMSVLQRLTPNNSLRQPQPRDCDRIVLFLVIVLVLNRVERTRTRTSAKIENDDVEFCAMTPGVLAPFPSVHLAAGQ
jgi:hypothetical protein